MKNPSEFERKTDRDFAGDKKQYEDAKAKAAEEAKAKAAAAKK